MPLVAAILAERQVHNTPLGDAMAKVCSFSGTGSAMDAMSVAWNFIPFAALMAVLAVLICFASRLAAWLAFAMGAASTVFVFGFFFFAAEESLQEKAWTGSALARGLAPLLALVVSAVVAILAGVVTILIQKRSAASARGST